MSTIKKTEIVNVGEDMEKTEYSSTSGAVTLENSLTFS